jgi:hypothetical protein
MRTLSLGLAIMNTAMAPTSHADGCGLLAIAPSWRSTHSSNGTCQERQLGLKE